MSLETFRPRRFLFATWEGGGNIPPAMQAARALVRRGHEVAVLCDDATAADVCASGARPIAWRHAPNRPDRRPEADLLRDWEAPSEPEGLALVRDRLFVGPAAAYARDVLDALGTFDADAVVPNDMIFGAILGAEAAKKPLALLSANISMFPLPGLPPFGPGFFPATNQDDRERDAHVAAASRAMIDVGLAPFNQARRTLGLAPIDTLFDVAEAADLVLLATSRAFDYPLAEAPEKLRYIGPLLAGPAWIPSDAETPIEAAPQVVIAFSTTFQDQAQALANAIAAMEGLPVRAVATLGPSMDRVAIEAPANVALLAAGDHDRLMANARLVITHAGHGTVMRALSHGAPLICLPMGRDQNDNAARVAFHGAGLRLARTASAAEIRDAAQAVLADLNFAAAAKTLQQALAREDAETRLIAELEALADARDTSKTRDRCNVELTISDFRPRD